MLRLVYARGEWLSSSPVHGLPHNEPLPCRYGKYELLERIGTGGMAEIFRARLPGLAGFEKIVVIKRLLPHFARDERMVELFVEEAKLAAQVQHKNVVQVFELDRLENGELFIAMEYVAGMDLSKILRTARRLGQRIPPWLSVYVVSEILDGLAFAYELVDRTGRRRNVVHRDVSPDNIFVSRLGDVKLGDFGVALDDTRQSQVFEGELTGKLSYMSPEQLASCPLDQRSDVFSAGVVLWECLTQRRLFSGKSSAETMCLIWKAPRIPPSRLCPDVWPELDQVVLDALVPEPTRRLPSARVMQERLLQILAARQPAASAPSARKTLRDLLRGAGGSVEHTFEDLDEVTHHGHRRPTAPELLDDATSAPPFSMLSALDDGSEPAGARTFPRIAPEPGSLLIARPSRPVPGVDDEELAREVWSYEDSSPRAEEALTASAGATATTYALIRPHIREAAEGPRPAREPELRRPDSGRAWGPYRGPDPLWLRTRPDLTLGPCTLEDVLHALRSPSAALEDSRLEISADGRRWIGSARLLELLEDEASGAGPSSAPPVRAGRLEETSVVALLGTLAAEEQSGRLLLRRRTATLDEHVELHVSNGAPLRISTNMAGASTCDLVLRTGLADPASLQAALRRAVDAELPLAEALERAGVSLASHRDAFMIARFEQLLTWDHGAYSFWRVSLDGVAFAPSLLALLPAAIPRARGTERLRALLSRALPLAFERSAHFDRLVHELGLGPTGLEAVRPLGVTATLADAVRASSGGEAFALAMAYVLSELGALRPSGS